MIIKVAAALLCGITSVAASDGLYVGVGTGASFMYGKVKNSEHVEVKKLRKHGDVVSAFVGYNHLIKDTPMFVGIEAGLQNHAMKKKIEGSVPGRAGKYDLSVSTNNSIAGHLKIGFVVSNVSFYCKAGVAQTNFKTAYQAIAKEKYTTDKKIGASTGIGVEAKINSNFSIGLEHTYVKYGSLKNISPDLGFPNVQTKFSPELNTTSLRLIYNF